MPVMKYLLVAFCLFCCCSLPGYGQYAYDAATLSRATRKMVRTLEKDNQLLGRAVTMAGLRPRQYDRFEKLKRAATVPELRQLTGHPNGVIRCYAFWALACHRSENLLPLVYAHINDTTEVFSCFGCIIDFPQVGDVFIDMVRHKLGDDEIQALDSLQDAQLDSALLCTPNKLRSRGELIYAAQPIPARYPVIRRIVVDEHLPITVVALSRYKQEADIPLILTGRDPQEREADAGYRYTYEAIRNFPHPDFFPFLAQQLETTWARDHYIPEWMPLYQAIAAYRDSGACVLLQQSLAMVKQRKASPDHLNFLTHAVSEYRCPVYDDLLWTLWTNEKHLGVSVFDYMLTRDSQRACSAAKATLLQPAAYYFSLSGEEEIEMSADDVLARMMEEVLRQEPEAGMALMGRQIREVDARFFGVFARRAAMLKDSALVEPLLARMSSDEDWHVYTEAAQTLAAYKDKAINARVLATIKQMPGRYWGDGTLLASLQE